MLKHVFSHWSLYLPFITIFCYMTIIAYSQGWGAPLFQRTFGCDPAKYSRDTGTKSAKRPGS